MAVRTGTQRRRRGSPASSAAAQTLGQRVGAPCEPFSASSAVRQPLAPALTQCQTQHGLQGGDENRGEGRRYLIEARDDPRSSIDIDKTVVLDFTAHSWQLQDRNKSSQQSLGSWAGCGLSRPITKTLCAGCPHAWLTSRRSRVSDGVRFERLLARAFRMPVQLRRSTDHRWPDRLAALPRTPDPFPPILDSTLLSQEYKSSSDTWGVGERSERSSNISGWILRPTDSISQRHDHQGTLRARDANAMPTRLGASEDCVSIPL